MGLELTAEKGDPRRWVVLILFCMYSSSNSIQWITYGSIATNARVFFNLTTNQLNMLSTIYMIVFDVGALFACTFFESWGVRVGVLIGGSLNTLGALLKFAPGIQVRKYAPIIVAQVINSFAQLFILSTPPLIAAQYFEPKMRAFATAAMATSNSLGIALAMIIPPFVVTRDDRPWQFYTLFGVELGYCAMILTLMAIFVRPPRFQAPSQALLDERQQMDMLEEQRRLMDGEKQRGRNNNNNDDENNDDNNNNDNEYEAQREGRQQEYNEPASEIHNNSDNNNNVSPPASTAGGTSATLKRPAFSALEEADGTATANELGGTNDDENNNNNSNNNNKGCWARIKRSEKVLILLHIGRTVWILFRNWDFMMLLAAISIGLGSVWAYSSVLAQILEPFGLNAELAGIAGALNYVVGTILAYILGVWVDRKRWYKWPLVACLTGAVLCSVAILIIMLKVEPFTPTMTGLTMFFYIFAGIFQNTAGPIAFEFAMELSYPLAESVPGALLMIGANVVSPILLSISSVMIGDGELQRQSGINVVIMMICVGVVGVICAILARERLYRRQAELRALAALEGDEEDEEVNENGEGGNGDVQLGNNSNAGDGSGDDHFLHPQTKHSKLTRGNPSSSSGNKKHHNDHDEVVATPYNGKD